ncbi:MAG TPA: hypothetical protein VE996_11000 [Terriglobales bacterium]|nr:hypothetical protein [Terriglobales bacterium]
MRIPSIVVVTLANPREKIWGQLLALNPGGLTVRGVELNSFDDFIAQILEYRQGRLPFPTSFFPMHRVERVSLDESIGEIAALGERFRSRVGASIEDYLADLETRG